MTDRRMGKVVRTTGKWRPPGYRKRMHVISAVVSVFAALAVVTGIWGIARIITDIMRPDTAEEEPIPTPYDEIMEEASAYGDGSALDILVMKMSDDGSRPEYLMLTRFEPSEERVYITDLLTTLQLGDRSLIGWYKEYGVETMAEKLADYLGCERVYTVRLNYKQIRLTLNAYGGVEYQVPYPIIYKSPKGDRDINVPAGTRLYTGGETARILNYPGWKNGEVEHRRMYCEVLAAFISHQLMPERIENITADYSTLLEQTQCDLPRTVLQQRLSGLGYLAKRNKGSLTMIVEIKKDIYSDTSTGYTEEGEKLIRAVFGDRDS